MMWGMIANLKENLNKIAQDVHDDSDEEEFEIYASTNGGGGQGSSISDGRNSHSFAHSKSPSSRSPVSNGVGGSGVSPEIEQYRAEIKRSEAKMLGSLDERASRLKDMELEKKHLESHIKNLQVQLATLTAEIAQEEVQQEQSLAAFEVVTQDLAQAHRLVQQAEHAACRASYRLDDHLLRLTYAARGL